MPTCALDSNVSSGELSPGKSRSFVLVKPSVEEVRMLQPGCMVPGTLKAGAWTMLCGAGAEGLPVGEIAERVQAEGLRDLSRSRNPEAAVAKAVMRDAVFSRVRPGVYALHAVVMAVSQLEDPGSLAVEVLPREEGAEARAEASEVTTIEMEEAEDDAIDSSHWVFKLEKSDYNQLTLQERVQACPEAALPIAACAIGAVPCTRRNQHGIDEVIALPSCEEVGHRESGRVDAEQAKAGLFQVDGHAAIPQYAAELRVPLRRLL
eukprot:jgi/Tetstr1/442178/TSEL_030329.t1